MQPYGVDEELLEEDDNITHSSVQPGIFNKEIRFLLNGFGDDANPFQDTVDLLEQLAIDYVVETTKKAVDISKSGRVMVEDIIFLIRKDERKFSRVKELLLMNDELKKARKQFEEEEVIDRPPTGNAPGKASTEPIE